MSVERVVFDSNILLSRILWPQSVPAQAVSRAVADATVLISDVLLAELHEVLARPKFAGLVDRDDARGFVRALSGIAERVELTVHVMACRDPRDDHVLALAVSGEANLVVTGDADLLVLDPFRGIRIITARAFLDRNRG